VTFADRCPSIHRLAEQAMVAALLWREDDRRVCVSTGVSGQFLRP
jgi:hypothetical protein